jgi:hypothetical protein
MPVSVNVFQKTQKTKKTCDFGESNPWPSAQHYYIFTTATHTHSCLYIICYYFISILRNLILDILATKWIQMKKKLLTIKS